MVRARAVGAVRLVADTGGRSVGAAASVELPQGTLKLSVSEANVARPEVFRSGRARSWRRPGSRRGPHRPGAAGPGGPRGAGPGGGDQGREGRHRGDAPVPAPEDRSLRDSRVRVCGFPRDVRRRTRGPWPRSYGRCRRSTRGRAAAWAWSRAGLSPAWRSCRPSRPGAPGDQLLVNWDDGYVSLVLSRRRGGPRSDPHRGEPAAPRTWRGRSRRRCFTIASAWGARASQRRRPVRGGPVSDAAQALAEPVGLRPSVLGPVGTAGLRRRMGVRAGGGRGRGGGPGQAA